MAKRKEVSVRVLRRLIDYDPTTGEMWWKERPIWLFAEGRHGRETNARVWNDKYAGQAAMASPSNGYLTGHIFKRTYLAHRVAFALSEGRWPEGEVDHINGDKRDNRAPNLRDVSKSENARNLPLTARSRHGALGVRWHKRDRRWQAHINLSGCQIHLGTFARKQDAIAARKAAERKYAFHPNHGRPK